MRTIYVDENGMSDTDTPIQDGEIVMVNINGKFTVTVLGSAKYDIPSPCLRCPLGTGVIADELPRCPRVPYPGDADGCDDDDCDDDCNDYSQYEYLCQGVALTNVSDVLGEL